MSLWSCTTCFKSFARKGDLTRHKSIHTGIKPHVCETCGKGFAQFSGLKTHRNVHSKAKPYVCGIGTCTKAFGDPSSRTRHRKETHRREGAYKCIITDCGTRIKRRSAFVAHLRKHGLDPDSLDLDAIVLQSNEREIPTVSHFVSPDAENKSNSKTKSRSVSPSFLSDGSGYYILSDGDRASHFMDDNRWPSDRPLDCRRVSWSHANNLLSQISMPDQTMHIGSSGPPQDAFMYPTSNLETPFYFDHMFPALVDYPLRAVPPSNLPTLEPFLEVASDGFQSSSSSPLSTYSTLCNADLNDDVASLSPANNLLDPLLFNLL